MPMYQVSATKGFAGCGEEYMTLKVFVMADNNCIAKDMAKHKFKVEIEEHLNDDTSKPEMLYDQFDKLSIEELEKLYVEDAQLESLHIGARGSVEVIDIENCSEIEVCW